MGNFDSKMEFAESFKKRTKHFAIDIIKFLRGLPKNREAAIISNQLFRAVTSVASNYRAACRARSTRAFYAKLCIVVEEADEVVFWLELMRDANICSSTDVNPLIIEGTEILAIVAKSRKTVGNRLN